MNKNDLFDRKWSAKIRVFNRNQKTSQDLQWTKKKKYSCPQIAATNVYKYERECNLPLSISWAKCSSPSNGFDVDSKSFPKHSLANCNELLIDDHIDSIIEAVHAFRTFGTISRYRSCIMTLLSSASKADHGKWTSTRPIWPYWNWISHLWFAHNSLRDWKMFAKIYEKQEKKEE